MIFKKCLLIHVIASIIHCGFWTHTGATKYSMEEVKVSLKVYNLQECV